METIYEKSLSAIERGSRFSVNLQKRSLSIDGKYVIRNGKYDGDLGTQPFTTDWLNVLYIGYRHSIPSERSEHRCSYFQALSEEELSAEDMLYGTPRDLAQARIELFVLFSILNGSLKWQNDWGSWFWQSDVNPDLVLLRSWVE